MQRRSIFIFAGMLAATLALADGAWKWTDANGVEHYSDVPVDGAEEINLSEYTRKTGARISRNTPPANSAEERSEEAPFRYESIAITAPAAEETLWNIEGVLSVSLTLSPRLQTGHRIQAYFDGQPTVVPGPNFKIDEVYRGVHNLQVEVINASGKMIVRSLPNRFYVQQNVVTR